ncbi:MULTISPECIES: NUDIX domain-containing protein [Caproicibacterium]|nr:NUDIX domain-containing protein [Caproicibacterium lactatifermentans]MDD4808408.1 NUDIX domain-containing protein [Oscillospiraceae bacterium]
MPENLTVYNSFFTPLGSKDRAFVHKNGLWHAVAHCWVVSQLTAASGEKETWVWLQQRAHNKDNAPDYYDISVGGHIRAGESPLQAVLRETEEELGLLLHLEDVELLGVTKENCVSSASPFPDREFGYVFLHRDAHPLFRPGEEVQDIVRVRAEDLCRKDLQDIKTVPAVSLSRGSLSLRADQFCIHPNEFVHLVFPKLEV